MNRWKWEVALADVNPKIEPAASKFERIVTSLPHWATYVYSTPPPGHAGVRRVSALLATVRGASRVLMYPPRRGIVVGAVVPCARARAAARMHAATLRRVT